MANGTSSLPKRPSPSPTSRSSGRARTTPRRRSAPMARVSATAGTRPATTCGNGLLRLLAPKEGAFAWNQGYMLLANAKNVDQAHEFAKLSTARRLGAAGRGVPANRSAKGGIDLAEPEGDEFYKARLSGRRVAEAVVVADADQRVPRSCAANTPTSSRRRKPTRAGFRSGGPLLLAVREQANRVRPDE